MRCFAVIFVLCAVSLLNLAQTSGSRPKTQTTKPKPKTAQTPARSAVSKPKPKPLATPVKKPVEKDAWDRAINTVDREARIVALQKFIETFPRSAKRSDALTMIVILRAEGGNEKLAAGESEAAAAAFISAATDAPKPIPDQLWTDTLSKIAANLYFRGARERAIAFEKILESKADGNAKQLLGIANFYMMIENGAEAKRIAASVIALEPTSSAAYQTLGLANRIDFDLSGSAAAYERSLELDPTSINAKRGLAEMKRALGKSDEAVALYRDLLTADPANIPAQTGLILSLFDSGKRSEAESELSRSLEANPGNVILLAGAAYWYSSHNEGAKAAELAQKAIDNDPRYVWSYIALARGFLLQKRAADAEKTLLAARQYGNFPTLEYELALARLAAGYYREAAEGLSAVFSLKDGTLGTSLGGRVPREALSFNELISGERQASIFAPVAAADPESDTQLVALLEFRQQLGAAESRSESVAGAAEKFAGGSDAMRVFRQMYVAGELLDRRMALPKVLDLTRAAAAALESGLDLPNASIATMAGELYEARALAAGKGEYIVVPTIPRQTMSAVLRGRIEELAGWANYNLGSPDEAVVRLRRAVGVLPVNSAWWRSSMWRLGAALALAGKDAEALDTYIKSYKSSGPDVIRYGIIEALYRKVNGNTDGLTDKIGPNPMPQVAPEVVSQKVEAAPAATPTPTSTPEPTPQPEPSETPEVKPESTPVATPAPSPEASPAASPTPQAENSPAPQPQPESTTRAAARELFPPVVITIPAPTETRPATSEVKVEPTPTPAATSTPESQPTGENVRPRVVDEGKTAASAEIKPCTIVVSEETIDLKVSGGDLAVITRLEDDSDVDAIKAVTSSPQDVSVRREPIPSVRTRAIFVLRSISERVGVYQIVFQLPCGKRTVTVNVR